MPRRGTDLAVSRARLRAVAEQNQLRKELTNHEYYGGDRREQAIRSFSSGVLDAAVTRNHYGCLVLNARHTLFIDVDLRDATPITATTKSRPRSTMPWQNTLDDLRIVLASEKNEGFRIYRTAAGFRILATTHEFDPNSQHATRLMESAGADAAFVQLCRIQKNFRARLTPKPWRCGTSRPPNFFPRKSADESRRFTEWLCQYERACRGHATCLFLGHVGAERTHHRIAPVIELHDRETKALELLPLA